jgi:NADH:ubiquinone oxidoreductase subunit 3 (subunit A)
MPVKRAAQKAEGAENGNNEVGARNRMPLAYYAIIIVIVLFGINVS